MKPTKTNHKIKRSHFAWLSARDIKRQTGTAPETPGKPGASFAVPLASKRGLSLMEVLFSLAILTIVMAGVGASFSNTAKSNQAKSNQAAALQDAVRIIEHARYVLDTTGINGDLTDNDYWTNWFTAANAFVDYSSVSREVAVINTASAPYEVRVIIRWQEQGASKQFTLGTLLTSHTKGIN